MIWMTLYSYRRNYFLKIPQCDCFECVIKKPMGQTIGFLLLGNRTDNYSQLSEYVWDKFKSRFFTDIKFIKKVNRTPLNDVFDLRHEKCVCVCGYIISRITIKKEKCKLIKFLYYLSIKVFYVKLNSISVIKSTFYPREYGIYMFSFSPMEILVIVNFIIL